MTVVHAIALGILQGVTEFLPVSSSGHLALAQRLIPGFSQPGVVFDVALHLGTVVSVLAMEARRLREAVRYRYAFRLAAQLVVATVATAAVALPLRHTAEAAFGQPLLVGCGLALSGLLLLLLPRGDEGRDAPASGLRDALFVGLVQGVAVMPGVSRSGSTIVAGAVAGLQQRWAADFSFLVSIPAVLGAVLVEAVAHRDALAADPGFLLLCGAGAGAAAVSGALAITAVRLLLARGRLRVLAAYLLPLAGASLVASVLGWW